MATGILNNGDYSIEDDSNGNLIVTDANDNTVLTYDDGAGQWELGTLDATAVNTEVQNNNEVNLTKLVDGGEYQDILDAIANEPATNPRGTRHVIEPGEYGPLSTQRVVTWSNREVSAYGRGHKWNATGSSHPVVIRWDGGTDYPLKIGDGVTNMEGGLFRGLEFVPDAAGNGAGAILFDATNSSLRDFEFRRCAFRRWGGRPVDYANIDTFGHTFRECSIHDNSQAGRAGKQQTFVDNYILIQSGNSGWVIEDKSQSRGTIAAVKNGSTGIVAEDGTSLNPKNIEGDGSAGSVGIEAGGVNSVTLRGGRIDNTDIGVKCVEGPLYGHVDMTNIGTSKYAFEGGANSHNVTHIWGDIRPSEVAVSNSTQKHFLIDSAYRVANAAAGDIPPGWRGIDENRGGSGNVALIRHMGSAPTGVTQPVYWDYDGSL